MANKAAGAGQDNPSLDDLKIEEFSLEDNALFADLDNEMRADGGKGSGAAAALDDLNLDFDVKAEPAPALEAPGEKSLDDTLDLDLNLDDAPKDAATGELDLGEAAAPPGGDAGGDLDLDLDLGEETPSAAGGAADLDLNLDRVSGTEGALDLDAAAGDLDLDSAPGGAPAAGGKPGAHVATATPQDDELDLGGIEDGAAGEGAASDAGFAAAPDINLDDIDLELDMPGGRGGGMEDLGETSLEPKGAQVDLQQPRAAAAGVIKEFEMPPLADTRGDVEAGPAERFEALPDVELPDDSFLQLNLGAEDAGRSQPEFTMAPEEPSAPAPVADREEIPLGEPLAAGRPAAPARAAAVPQDLLLNIPHRLSVQMGAISLMGRDLRGLAYGSVVQLNRTVGEPVELLLDGRAIAQGEIVLINGKNLGVRILALNK